MDNKDEGQIGELEQDLKDLEEKIIEENKNELGKGLEELEKIDISKLGKDTRNLYKGPTNGPLFLDIIKDGKAIKRYIGKD